MSKQQQDHHGQASPPLSTRPVRRRVAEDTLPGALDELVGDGAGRVRLVDEVAHVLRQRIYSGAHAPGELLRQVQLSQQLNVSRTPLREALRMLQSEGLVEADGPRGVCVARADRQRLLNAYALREMIDGLAARQAAERQAARARARLMPLIEQQLGTLEPWSPADYVRFNVDFHAAIIELADNEFLSGQMAVVRLTSTVFAPAVLVSRDRARPAVDEHALVVQAIAAGDGEAAERLARQHIRETIACLLAGRGAAATIAPAAPPAWAA
ncbi:GntR family transcriptional regulator [Roseateles violae]|uniref:GntR family transcriptional regulator n=1 Tax=Roseateles violae TaxID=3058042 RepID=A0ABT8DMW0_9BURK|nr:GntR family transcriptional regulator [Pelomonas sp. PFR6]MDN3919462.1 GntR family transcriptional regulator [Pelomonas sp. PFR6]